MHKVVTDTKISFYDNSNTAIMYIDYLADECVWYFNNNEVITITEDMELFELLKSIMSQQYKFNDDEILKSYKSNNKLIWYSDCYYNPDDEWSRNSVSYLTIEFVNDDFKLQCTKPLDDMIDRGTESHVIGFSPLGNGKYARNIKSGLMLQDDFVLLVYQNLLKNDKVKKLHR